MRLVWAFGIENRQATTVLPCLHAAFEDLRSLTGGSRPPILRLHSDKAKEFSYPVIRAYLSQQGGRTGSTDEGDHITMMSYVQFNSQVRSQDLTSKALEVKPPPLIFWVNVIFVLERNSS